MVERIIDCGKCAKIPRPLRGRWSRRIKYARLPQFAPFLIKKEKCSGFTPGIQLGNKYRPAQVVAEHIKSQRRLGLPVQVGEKIIGVQVFVAEIFPRGPVEVPAA